MMMTVSKGLSDIEELEKIKVEERIQIIAETAVINVGQIESIFERPDPTDIGDRCRMNF